MLNIQIYGTKKSSDTRKADRSEWSSSYCWVCTGCMEDMEIGKIRS